MDVSDTIPISGLDLEGRLLRTLAILWRAGVVSREEALEPLRQGALRRKTSRAVLPARDISVNIMGPIQDTLMALFAS